MSQASKHPDALEGTLVGLLGLVIVIFVTGLAYFFISGSAPRNMDDFNLPTAGCISIFGLILFLYGSMGIIQGTIVVGWGTMQQVRTRLVGPGAYVASSSTVIGALLILAPVAIYFVPELIAYIHPLAALLCGLVAPILGWICGPGIRRLGY